MTVIAERYSKIVTTINDVCESFGRDPNEIKLVVVTKGHSVENIVEAIHAGAQHLGENYPEETHQKMHMLGDELVQSVQWHMIGHLQSRKIPLILTGFDVFHALDSIRLAEKMDHRVTTLKRGPLPVLLQYNVSGEAEKAGIPAWDESLWPELLMDFERIVALKGLSPIGLMTMPPFTLKQGENRLYFDRLRRLRAYFAANLPALPLDELSMGTSQDYQDAIKEGATYLRIGTEIMGKRSYIK